MGVVVSQHNLIYGNGILSFMKCSRVTKYYSSFDICQPLKNVETGHSSQAGRKGHHGPDVVCGLRFADLWREPQKMASL